MKKRMIRIFTVLMFVLCMTGNLNAQNMTGDDVLSVKQQSLIPIAANTAKGELQQLKTALNEGLDAGLTVNEVKEAMVHLYAYSGFPRSIRGLQTLMEVLEEREAKGITDEVGIDASPIHEERSKYERGKEILEALTGVPQSDTLSGYAAFTPVIDVFLKEHLFADIFERDVLTFAERELVTISVLSSIGRAEPMLRSHLHICLHLGFTPGQLHEFVGIIKEKVGKKEAREAQSVLNELLNAGVKGNREDDNPQNKSWSSKGNLAHSPNFTGTVWLNMLGTTESGLHASVGNVTFAPGARTHWHAHPGGQILFITKGEGVYQVKGQPARFLQKGDYVEIPSDVIHWHGASPDSEFSHIAVSLNTDLGGAVWSGPVTDDECDWD